MELHGLGYVGFTAADPAEWRAFATGVLGMMPAKRVPGEAAPPPGSNAQPASGGSGIASDGSVYLKMDERQWRVGIHPGDGPGLAYLGFDVADDRALAAAVDEAQALGATFKMGTPEEAAARGVQGLAWCTDPAGQRVELYHGPVHDRDFVSPHGVEFLTGTMGLGHVLLFVPEMEPCLDFYRDVLGFRRSDWIPIGEGLSLQFLRCTPRHHSVALIHVGPMSGVHHLMVEMTSIDQVGAALDRAQDAGCTITMSLGRHLNDRMVSFYVQSPAGFDVEVGWDGLIVDDATWCEREATGTEPWGHRGFEVPDLEAFGEALTS